MLIQFSIINSNIQKLIHILFAKHSQKNLKQSNAAQHDSCSSCASAFSSHSDMKEEPKFIMSDLLRRTVSADNDDLHSHFI